MENEQIKQLVIDNVINSTQVAELLGCTRQYVHKLVKQGKLIPLKEFEKERIFWKPDILSYKQN